MNLDLSALEAAASTPVSGKPLEIDLAAIVEDPNQPRKEFTSEAINEMVADIEAHGVMNPITVRANPDEPGKWIIVTGARRWRAARIAGLATIPALVDERAIDAETIRYRQMAENMVRDDLKPHEIARFIADELNAGKKASKIAKSLHKDAAFVTHHAALASAPPLILDAYNKGCTSVKTLYDLGRLYSKHTLAVEVWYEQQTEPIDRRAVAALAEMINGATETVASAPMSIDAPKPAGEVVVYDPPPAEDEGDAAQPVTVPYHNPDNERPEPKATDASKIRKPLLMGEFKKQPVMVLLNRRPSTAGLIFIRYEESGLDEEVDAREVKLLMLSEARG
jgi:ParB family chromosome partitioning protein